MNCLLEKKNILDESTCEFQIRKLWVFVSYYFFDDSVTKGVLCMPTTKFKRNSQLQNIFSKKENKFCDKNH